jgi:protein arginine kinase activator
MDSFPVCTQCGFTLGEYRTRGLLGCAHCYTSFGDALQADLLWLHHALILPEAQVATPDSGSILDPESLSRWRRNLTEALKVENYTEAARLNLLIQAAEAKGRLGDIGLA